MLEQLDNRPRCVARVLIERLAPYKGRVYDPCCRSAGMFVQSEKFVEEHGGRIGDIATTPTQLSGKKGHAAHSKATHSLNNGLQRC